MSLHSRRRLLALVGLGVVATSCATPATGGGPPPLDLSPQPTAPTSSRTVTTARSTAAPGAATGVRAAPVGRSGLSRTAAAPVRGLPRAVLGGYWPLWPPSAVRIRNLPGAFNVVYVFAGVPSDARGSITLGPAGDGRGAQRNLVADIAHARSAQGRSVILSVGGAGAGIAFDSRATSSRFVDSVRSVVDGLGGLDGLDLNTFEADASPDLTEYAWISRSLKAVYGEGFAITAPPAPWNVADRQFCRAMVADGLMDLCGPQYYGGAGLATPGHITSDIGTWVELVGARRLCVGFGVGGSGDYMTTEQCVSTWTAVASAHPDIRGAFVWNVATDESDGWGFANRVGPLVTG